MSQITGGRMDVLPVCYERFFGREAGELERVLAFMGVDVANEVLAGYASACEDYEGRVKRKPYRAPSPNSISTG